jgi:hypothetical protein
MKCDKDRFLTLNKEIYRSISFGNDNLAKIIGSGTFKLGSKDFGEVLVKNMKHNL